MKIIKKIKKAAMSKSKKKKKSVAKKIDKKILKALKERYLKAKKDKKEAKAAYKMAKSFFEKNQPKKKTKVKAKTKAKVKTIKVKPVATIAKPKSIKPKSNATVTTLSELKPTPSKVAKKLPKPLRVKRPKATPKKDKPLARKKNPVAKKVTPAKRVTTKKATPKVAPKPTPKPVVKTTVKNPTPKAAPVISKKQMEDLKVVEGIGPAIERILKSQGIKTLDALSKAKVATLRNILTEAGNRFRFHKPDTWARQARLAAAGRWKELEELQQRLDGGKKK